MVMGEGEGAATLFRTSHADTLTEASISYWIIHVLSISIAVAAKRNRIRNIRNTGVGWALLGESSFLDASGRN